MGDTNSLNSLQAAFSYQKDSFEPWIEYIRFPKYKSLKKDFILHFSFPITIIVGKNGVNKTSILHALYGVPEKQSVGNYWFSTDVDKIDSQDTDNSKKHCMIYAYNHYKAKRCVEVLKTRVNNKKNLDYWEPARPQKQYEMIDCNEEDLTRLGSKYKTRWENLEKTVIFCDNKEYVSAYDLLFYHSTYKGNKLIASKQDFIRSRSRPLGRYINKITNKLIYRGKNRLIEDRILSSETVRAISLIMDEEYDEIRIIQHSLYTNLHRNDCMIRPAQTILLKKKGLQYSEAFAGSGESRLILLVDKIKSASKNTLVLIDEPEISLHPEAIYRFRDFLISETLRLKLQVVVTTHSIHFIENFPPEAIKLLERIDNKVSITENVNYKSAFYSIGATIDAKLTVFVEDKLVKYLLEYYIKKINDSVLHNNVHIKICPGGAESIVKNIVRLGAIDEFSNIMILLDGDKYKDLDTCKYLKAEYFIDGKIDVDRIPVSENNRLSNIIKELTGVEFDSLPINGNHINDNTDKLFAAYRAIISYWSRSVVFLGKFKTPEDLLIESMQMQVKCKGKDEFLKLTQNHLGVEDVSAEDIFFYQKGCVPKIEKDSFLYKEVQRIIDIIKLKV
ncbi:MAG: AAA family ATPase [Veillonella sp.]|uniref:AAA family ATPase n=1 Tax=Veillonella sp. TaxID=1926307 RepID=UPI0029071C83|nr:AAA family ATPase [Veillonella sp.]MDU7715363.1 AAA family ATPase [Veillonella sp.]